MRILVIVGLAVTIAVSAESLRSCTPSVDQAQVQSWKEDIALAKESQSYNQVIQVSDTLHTVEATSTVKGNASGAVSMITDEVKHNDNIAEAPDAVRHGTESSYRVTSGTLEKYDPKHWQRLFDVNNVKNLEICRTALYPRSSLAHYMREYAYIEPTKETLPVILGPKVVSLKISDVYPDEDHKDRFQSDAREFWRMVGTGFPKLEEVTVFQMRDDPLWVFDEKDLDSLKELKLRSLSVRDGFSVWSLDSFQHFEHFAYTLEFLELESFADKNRVKDFLRKFPRLKKAKINGVEYDFPL